MDCHPLPEMAPRRWLSLGCRTRPRRGRLPLLAGGGAAALATLWCLSAQTWLSFAPQRQQRRQLPLGLAGPQAALTASSSSSSSSTAAWHHRGGGGQRGRTRLAATSPSFQGQVKAYTAEKGFGFIECPETFGMFQRDVFLHKQQADLAGVAQGDTVTFSIETNDKGQPQARDVQVFAQELPPEDVPAAAEENAAEDAWAAAEVDRQAMEDAWAAAEDNGGASTSPTGDASEDDLARRLELDPLFIAGVKEVRKQGAQLEKELIGAGDMELEQLTAKQKDFARCSKITGAFDELVSTVDALEEAKELAASGSELAELALEEAEELKDSVQSLKQALQTSMLPVDPRDEANTAILEIRPGAGGGEAALWAEDLLNMYTRFCEAEGMRCKIIAQSSREGGGLMDVQMEISGAEVYSKLKFEAGVHRVQRVPATEKANRIHTSTATVALMPELEGIDDDFSLNDCEITFCRAGGPGGQNVNKVSTACRIKHLPSGVELICREERSQVENKMRAIRYIKARLLAAKLEARDQEYAALRKDQLGTGDRSEKVRSYNFKEDRVSDHRLGRNFQLQSVLQGNLGEPVRLLRVMEQQEKLAAFEADMKKRTKAA